MPESIKSLVWATDVDVLAADHELTRRDGYWVVRSPHNPTYWWGNFLLFDQEPGSGDGERWESLFDRELGYLPQIEHRAVAWDTTDGSLGEAERELVARGYELELTAGLVATAGQIRAHPRANREAQVRRLDPAGDEQLWSAVLEMRIREAPDELRESGYHRPFVERHQQELRELLQSGRGGAYVALLDGQVAGSLAIVVTAHRARYQQVETAAAFRRLGIARRLVVDAAHDALARDRIECFVIAADPDYHALALYEGLGFKRVELVVGALRKP